MQTSKAKKVATVSVVLATYNEAANIARCLESIQDVADEIIVVDGNSSDETAKIAKTYGATVLLTSNKPIFHINKQMAMDAATCDIVLQLDADEVVDSELKAFIQQLAIQFDSNTYDTKTQPVAWWIKRRNLFLGTFLQKGGQYPDPVIRLYINGFARLPQKDVHEQMEVDGIVATANGHLIHYSNPTFTDYLRKWNAYSSLAANELIQNSPVLSFSTKFEYLFVKPMHTFLSIFIRHKGIVDGIPGFLFAYMSGLMHVVTLLKAWEISKTNKNSTS